MADLTPRGDTLSHREGRAGRGQMILVGGFALALALVSLALVMNSAIYTENVATRSESTGTSNAHAYQRATTVAAVEAFEYAHEHDDETRTDLATSVTEAVEAYNNVTTRQYVATGQMVNASVVSTTDGTKIADDSGDFAGPGDGDDWTVGRGVTDVREFELRATAWTGSDGETFRIVADDVGTWSLNVTYDGSAYAIGVNNSGTYTTCETTTVLPVTINVSAGTVDGASCPGLRIESVPGSYDLAVENGDAIGGRYSLILDAEETYTPNPGAPTTEPVLYSTTVELTYRSTDLEYRTRIRVAPGERYE